MNSITYKDFNTYCQSLPETTYVNQWGGAHVWKVGGKVFAVGGWDKPDAPAVSFKVSPHNYDVLKDEQRFKPAPYLASRGMKWIQQLSITHEHTEELKYYLKESHRIVSLGLTKKLQKALGLNQ